MAFAALIPLIGEVGAAGGAEAAAGGAAVAGEGAAAGGAATAGGEAAGIGARAATGLRFGARAARMHAAQSMGQQHSPKPESHAPAMPREGMMGGYENVVNQAQMSSNWG